MILNEKCRPELQRIRYKKGQSFSSKDLTDDNNIASSLRWLHNRALHDVYGINEGLGITGITDTNGKLISLDVEAGLAYDCFGRELINQKLVKISLPSMPLRTGKILTLLIRYKESNTSGEENTIKASCLTGDSKHDLEQAEFIWKPESLVEVIDGVPLARIFYEDPENPQLLQEESESPISRPLARPRIASGATMPGQIVWEIWSEKFNEEIELPNGKQTTIDTSAAGFTDTPCYFASLQGYSDVNGQQYLLSSFHPYFQQVYDSLINNFTFRILFFPGYWLNKRLMDHLMSVGFFRHLVVETQIEDKLYISWLGIQCKKKQMVRESSGNNKLTYEFGYAGANAPGQNKIERPEYYPSKKLDVSDVQGIDQINRQWRWLHNRTFHRPGIGSGFAVSGKREDREVLIEPGYAVDLYGREIVLTRKIVLPVPPVAGKSENEPVYFYLTISFKTDLEEAETRGGICYNRGVVRLQEEPDFCWVKLNSDTLEPDDQLKQDIERGEKIVLMKVGIQNCALSEDLSVRPRQNARPVKGPNIVSGIHYPDPSKTEWVIWDMDNGAKNVLGLKISIDTSDANFVVPPNYQVEIVGNRFVDTTIDSDGPYMLDGFTRVIIETEDNKKKTTEFILYLRMPNMNVQDLQINPTDFFNDNNYSDSQRQEILHQLHWGIKWIGIEG